MLVPPRDKVELFTTDFLHAEPRGSFSLEKAGGHGALRRAITVQRIQGAERST